MGWEAGSGPPGPGPEPPRPCSSGPLSSRHFQPFTGLVKDDDARAWPPGSAPKTRTPPRALHTHARAWIHETRGERKAGTWEGQRLWVTPV